MRRRASLTHTPCAVSAVFSACGTWRYELHRELPGGNGTLNFVMLNPSTADAVRDDPTIRRCIGFARAWGFAHLVVTNLFALRTPEPRRLALASDPVGPENDRHLVERARGADRVICAWGIHGRLAGRDAHVVTLLDGVRLEHLGLTRAGQPRHPLYLKGNVLPQGALSGRRAGVPVSVPGRASAS
jgi:hypothetical protein